MGKGRSKEPEFVERQAAAASARKAMLENFLAKAGKPADAGAAAQQPAPTADDRGATRQVREPAKAETPAKATTGQPAAATAAKREPAPQPERRRAEKAERNAAAKAPQKMPREARPAAGKTKEKAGAKKGKR